jgi:GAF domain-containing protein/HAMP domain-containing protein
MKAILRFLNPIEWPIWLKLSALVTLVLAFVALIGVLLFFNLQAVDAENLQTFLIGEGEDIRENVEETLTNAETTVNNYTVDPARRDALVSIMTSTAQDFDTRKAESDSMNTLLESTLMAADLFSNVRLLTLDGLLVAGVGGSISKDAIYERQDESGSTEFRAAENTRLLNHAQDTIVSEQGVPKIFITQVVFDLDGLPVGYLIATIAISDVIVPLLEPVTSYVPIFTYLVRRNAQEQVIFVPREGRTRAEDSVQTTTLQRALNGLIGNGIVERYTYVTEIPFSYPDGRTVQNPETQSVIGYYVEINRDLALIAEAPADSTFQNTLTGLTEGTTLFVLAVAVPPLIALLVAIFAYSFSEPLQNIRQALRLMSKGNFDEPIPAADREDEFGQLAQAIVEMRDQVQTLVANLEQRIAARSRDIQATQEISRFAATQRDIQILMNRVVELVTQYFPNIYHAQIFLLDNDNKYAVLRSSTGEPGRKLLERGHRLAVGSLSVIGRVTEQGEYVAARDTATSDVHRRNEFLPDTRSELAIPLRVGEKIIGALDVQSKKPDAFPLDEINVLQTMADQIAVAIESANLYQESLRSLAEIERTKRRQTQQDWEEYMQMERVREISREYGTKTPLDTTDLRRAAIVHNRTMIGRPTERGTIAIAVPISLRGQVLGAAEWELTLQDFGEDKVLLAQELVNRLAVSMENARLFQRSQVAAERERLVNTIGAKLTSKQDIHEILQTALREVGQALRAPEVSIRMQWAGEQADSAKLSDEERYLEIRTRSSPSNGSNGKHDEHE